MNGFGRWFRTGGALAVVALAPACGGGGTEPPPPPPPTVVQVVITSPTTAPAFGALGRTAQFRAEPRDASGNVVPGKTPSWSSTNTAVATVSPTGLVTAVGNGTTTISASVDGKTDSLGVTVSQVTAQVVVTPPTKSFGAKGSTTQLTAEARDSTSNAIAGKTFVWSSTDPTVATVNPATGLVTSVANGSTTVRASVDGQSGNASVTVAIVVNQVVVTPGSKAFGAAGRTQAFTAVANDSNGNAIAGKTFAWSSTNTAVVTVDASTGVATSVANGSAQIRATADAVIGSASVTVDIVLASIAVTPKPLPTFTRIGVTQALTVTAFDSANNPIANAGVTWTSRGTAVVTVNGSGVAMSVADGATYVVATATSDATIKDSSQVAVAAVANSVSITPPSVAFGAIGSTQQLAATVRDSGGTAIPGRTVTWGKSTNNGVANVSAAGAVTSVANGSETITATAAGPSGDIAADVPVTVAQVANTVTVSSPGTTLFYAGQTMQFSASATDSNNNSVSPTPSFTWASTLTGVATVNASTGLATAGSSNGTTSIQAMTGGVTGSKNLTVNRLVASVTVLSARGTTNDTITTFTGTLVYNGTARDSGGTAIAGTVFTWTSSNTLAATLSPSSGASTTASVAGQGTTTVTGTASGKSAVATLVTIMPTVLFGTQVQTIFTANCAVVGCHVLPNPTGNLNLTSNACTRIVNVTSSAGLRYVLPGDPNNSYLMLRITGQVPPQMPESRPPLSAADQRTIRTWIQQNAPCN